MSSVLSWWRSAGGADLRSSAEAHGAWGGSWAVVWPKLDAGPSFPHATSTLLSGRLKGVQLEPYRGG